MSEGAHPPRGRGLSAHLERLIFGHRFTILTLFALATIVAASRVDANE